MDVLPQAHACIDLETLSLRVDAFILSIGACSWLEGDEPGVFRGVFAMNINPYQPGRHIDAATVAWWAMQSQEAREAAFGDIASGVVDLPPLSFALSALKTWLVGLGSPKVWTNDPSFDAAVLKHANGGELLWHFRNTRCCRTAADFVSDEEYDAMKAALSITKHTALGDAMLSGGCVQLYQQKTSALRVAAR